MQIKNKYLLEAIKSGNEIMVKIFIDNGAKPNSQLYLEESIKTNNKIIIEEIQKFFQNENQIFSFNWYKRIFKQGEYL